MSRSVNAVFINITFYLFIYFTFFYLSIFIIYKTVAMRFIFESSCDMCIRSNPVCFLDNFSGVLLFVCLFVRLLACQCNGFWCNIWLEYVVGSSICY